AGPAVLGWLLLAVGRMLQIPPNFLGSMVAVSATPPQRTNNGNIPSARHLAKEHRVAPEQLWCPGELEFRNVGFDKSHGATVSCVVERPDVGGVACIPRWESTYSV
ncbi:hypothetical protein P7K49_003268, partial [Saguinus oedipus]